MNILIVEDQGSVSDLIQYTILSKYQASFFHAHSSEEAIEQITDNKIDLVISEYNIEGENTGGRLYQYILNQDLGTPFALCSSTSPDNYDEFDDRKFFIEYIQKPNIYDGVNNVIKAYEIIHSSDSDSSLSPVLRTNSTYSQVSLDIVAKLDKAQCEIYAKVNDEKFVEVFKINDEISEDKIEKLFHKGFKSLYIKKDDSKFFFDLVANEIKSLLADIDGDDEDKVVKAHEKISEAAIQLGFSDALIEATEESVKQTLDIMKSNKDLKPVYKKLFGHNNNYLSMHSIALCYISCGILKQTEWNKYEAQNKLVFASYFHDVSITDPEFRENLALDKQDKKYLKIMKDHIRESEQFIKQFNEIPMDVDKIIALHHERPNGKGLNGISPAQIPPLAAIFILAHEIVDILIQLEQENVDPTIEVVNKYLKTEEYTEKHFKTAFEAYLKSELFI
jgi:HD-GYP domain-containing protein (c-di-GMP phosphodiesterase class II)/CheY-like chemotaxis protein